MSEVTNLSPAPVEDGSEAREPATTETEPKKEGNEATQHPAYQAQLAPDLRGHEALKDYENFSDITRALIELKGKYDPAKQIPSADAGEEEMNRFLESLGRPARPDGYKFEVKMPEGLEIAPETVAALKKEAFERGLTEKQADFHVNSRIQTLADYHKRYEDMEAQAREKAAKELEGEWGEDFEKNKTLAVRALALGMGHDPNADGFEAAMQELADSGYGNDPTILKAFHRFGAAMSDDSSLPMAPGPGEPQKRKASDGSYMMDFKGL